MRIIINFIKEFNRAKRFVLFVILQYTTPLNITVDPSLNLVVCLTFISDKKNENELNLCTDNVHIIS